MDRDQLLKDIRLEVLKITWPDPDRDKTIAKDIGNGIAYLSGLCPESAQLTFDRGTEERRLLENFVLYAQSNAEDDFRQNYHRDLGDFKRSKEVDDFEKSKTT